jgi:hypothetical protein
MNPVCKIVTDAYSILHWQAVMLYEVQWWGLFAVPRRIASTCISAMIKSQSRPSAAAFLALHHLTASPKLLPCK